MKKRMTALLLALCLLFSAVPAIAGAATGQQVSAADVSMTAGNSATVPLKAENFTDIATLEVYVYYDPAVLTLTGTTNGTLLSGAQSSVNTAEAGTVKLVAMALNGISGTGNLLSLNFKTASNCAPGTYPVQVAIGNVYTTAFAPATIGATDGSVTVTKPVATETFALYGYPSPTTVKKGDILSYRVASASSSRAFVSGEFVVEYDHELFAFEAVALETALTGEGAIYSVNSSVLGQVRIAYANDEPVKSFYLFTVKLKVIADTGGNATLTAQASNMYREDLSMYLPGSCSNSVSLQKLPQVTDDPDACLVTERLVLGRTATSVFTLEAGAGVAAADFTLTYDPTVLRCVSVEKSPELEALGGMLVVNDHFSEGTIRFSYIHMEGIRQEVPVAVIRWEPLCSPADHYRVGISGVGVVDPEQNPLNLEYVVDSGCIWTPSSNEPGTTTYTCTCGESFTEQDPVVRDMAGKKYFATLEEAIAEAQVGDGLVLLADIAGDVTVDKDLCLDLNGFDITGTVSVAEGCTLFGMDSQTDDFTVNDDAGYGKIGSLSGNVTGLPEESPLAEDGYLSVTEEDGISFHRVRMEITALSLRATQTGLYYTSAFAADEVASASVQTFGVALSVIAEPHWVECSHSEYTNFAEGKTVTGTLLRNIMCSTNTDAVNAANAAMPIYGRAYIRTEAGYFFGGCVSQSLQQLMESVDSIWDSLTQTQKEGVRQMYETYAAVMEQWEIPNIAA